MMMYIRISYVEHNNGILNKVEKLIFTETGYHEINFNDRLQVLELDLHGGYHYFKVNYSDIDFFEVNDKCFIKSGKRIWSDNEC